MKCPKCGREIANDSQYCELCGALIKKSGSKKTIWIISAIILSLCLIGGILIYCEKESDCHRRTPSCSQGVADSIAEYMDLGLPSGTLWATMNVGAFSPADFGDYFAWGETTGCNCGKTEFNWNAYQYCNEAYDALTKYCQTPSYGNKCFSDTLTELTSDDDAAYVNWGSEWRMPSKEQFEELICSEYTTTEWLEQNNVFGLKITSKSNGRSIFLPAAGCRNNMLLYDESSCGYYWSRRLRTDRPYGAWGLLFTSDGVDVCLGLRFSGLSIRPVRAFHL